MNKFEIEARNGQLSLDEQAVQILREYQALDLEMAAKKIQLDAVKSAVQEAMERYGIRKFENDFVSIAYIPDGYRKTVDSKVLKEQGLYDDFCKEVKVSASVRMTFKDE